MKPVDHSQRALALDTQYSVCVTAPAGSGKTELLSQRVLALLAQCQRPEEILAITFTRKAAAEMHHRIIDALRSSTKPEPPAEEHKRQTWQLARAALTQDSRCGWELLSNPARLKIQTIDSLCASITRQMPLLSRFGSQPQVSDNCEPYFQQAASALLAKLESSTAYADDLANFLAHIDNDLNRAQRLLVDLLKKRDQWLPHIVHASSDEAIRYRLEKTLLVLIEETLARLRQGLLPYTGELLPLLDYAGNCASELNASTDIASLTGIVDWPDVSADGVAGWLSIASCLLTGQDQWRKTVTKRDGFPTETSAVDKATAKARKQAFLDCLSRMKADRALHENLVELRHLPSACYSVSQWQMLSSLVRLLPALVAELTVVFHEAGEVDYSEISLAALRALGQGVNPGELLLRLNDRLRHILVDEFQDTATPQFELLSRLMEGWSEYNAENPDYPNTLFIVGDGMQSIYGFREANVGLFLEARHQGVNGVHLLDAPLQVNFRSTPSVVNWVNRIFVEAFPSQENIARGAVPYALSHAHKDDTEGSEVAVFGCAGDDAEALEAQQVVELVSQSLNDHPADDVAVLVRNRGHLRSIIPALSKAGISWNARDIDSLASYSPVSDLLVLTKALLNVGDRVAWTALLRVPYIGLDLADLHALMSDKSRRSVCQSILSMDCEAQLSRYGRARMALLREVLEAAFEQRQRVNLRSWVEHTWLRLGGATCLNNSNELDLVDEFFDLLEAQQRAGDLPSLAAFEKSVAALYASSELEDCKLSLLTIHKSKGLEFDTVILPGLAKPPRSDDKSLLMWREYLSEQGETGLLMSPLGAADEKDENPIYSHLRFQQSQATALENTRLLYVAATRAVKRLYLAFCMEPEKNGKPVEPDRRSLLHSVWPALSSEVNWLASAEATKDQYDLLLEEQAEEPHWRLSSNWREPAWSFSNPLQQYYLQADYDNVTGNRPEVEDMLPRVVGNVVHAIFEALSLRGSDYWSTQTEPQREQWLQSLLAYYQLPASRWPEACDRVAGAVNNMLADERGRWILSRQSVAHSEWCLLASSDDSVREYIIDRFIRDDEGQYWIIDYKTGQPQVGESQQQFVEREAVSYGLQLQRYKELVHGLGYSNVRAALYFTHYPLWFEISELLEMN